ncbi:hypothetical protein KCU92_g59, partial [Aureobasidium melanogenum]
MSEVVKSAPHVAREVFKAFSRRYTQKKSRTLQPQRVPLLLNSICVFGSPSMVAQGTDDDRRPSSPRGECFGRPLCVPSTCMSFLKKHPAVYECALVLRPGLNIFSIFCDLKDIGSSEHYSVIIGRCKRACHHEFRILIKRHNFLSILIYHLRAVVLDSISLSWCSLAILTGTILSPSTLISRSASCLMSPRKALFLNFEV